MGALDLFIASSIPVLKVLLITALGSYLALDHVNILGEDARKHINNLVFYVFNPALVASNLANTITYESMLKLWFMPFNVLITFLVGSILGWIVVQFTRPPSHLRGLIVGCCAAGNLGNMPLIIIPAVCKEKGSPFGSPDTCQTYGLAYASLSMAVGAIYLWSYVYNIVRASSTGISRESRTIDEPFSKSVADGSISGTGSCSEPLLSSKEFLTPADQLALPCTISEVRTQVKGSYSMKQQVKLFFAKINLKSMFAPSTIGALAGFIIGLVPLFRKSMIGDSAPLRVIQDSASLIGDGAIPTVTLVVGGNLLRGLRGSGIQKSIVFGIVVARYVALPLVGIVIVKGAVRFGFVCSDDLLYQFILLLQFAMPPAMNIGTITQLFGAGESECSVIMLWTYALASVSITLWSTFFLWLVS
ncbi:protein PIN-LIKES 1 [Citrus sinensis]|nr:protein PIN-LIKES 1 [Citrus sinensis]